MSVHTKNDGFHYVPTHAGLYVVFGGKGSGKTLLTNIFLKISKDTSTIFNYSDDIEYIKTKIRKILAHQRDNQEATKCRITVLLDDVDLRALGKELRDLVYSCQSLNIVVLLMQQVTSGLTPEIRANTTSVYIGHSIPSEHMRFCRIYGIPELNNQSIDPNQFIWKNLITSECAKVQLGEGDLKEVQHSLQPKEQDVELIKSINDIINELVRIRNVLKSQ